MLLQKPRGKQYKMIILNYSYTTIFSTIWYTYASYFFFKYSLFWL